MRKAYKIITRIHEPGDWSIYSGKTAGEAKTTCLYGMLDAYQDATYAWITSCRRAPEYDQHAEKYGGCVAWKNGMESFDIKLGHKRA
jgi:hypothetical protein